LHRLRAVAPLIGPRREVGRVVAADPFFQAAIAAWTAAADRGVMSYEPTVSLTGDGLRSLDAKPGKRLLLGDTKSWSSQATRGEKAAAACRAIAMNLRSAIRHAEAAGGRERTRAIAEYTEVMLEVTRVNCLHFAEFCRKVGPAWDREDMRAPRPPEIPVLRPDYLYSRILCRNLSLCHGVEPLLEYRFPGGEKFERELALLDERVSEFLRRYAHTPFAQAVRRQCLATFVLYGTPQAGIPRPRWVPPGKGGGTETPDADTPRPSRGAPSGGRTGGGTTSGGGD
jgi:hypothetical protein